MVGFDVAEEVGIALLEEDDGTAVGALRPFEGFVVDTEGIEDANEVAFETEVDAFKVIEGFLMLVDTEDVDAVEVFLIEDRD